MKRKLLAAILLLTSLFVSAQSITIGTEGELELFEGTYLMRVPNPFEKFGTKQLITPLQPKFSAADNSKTHFSWGADTGLGVDMTGHDMSSFDLSLYAGMRRGWIKFLGLGAQASSSIANSARYYSLHVLFRTNFMNRPSRFFWELRPGIAYNQLNNENRSYGAYAATAVGVNLASSSKFSSYMTLGYTFLQHGTTEIEEGHYLHFITGHIGIVF